MAWRAVIGVIVSLTLITICVFIFWRAKYEIGFQNAWNVYQSSRNFLSDPSEEEFALRGIKFGDSAEDVNRKMKGAFEAPKTLRPADDSQESQDTKFIKFYQFTYEPGLDVPQAGETYEFINEKFFVHFNEDHKAYRVERHLFVRGDADQTGVQTYDLRPLTELPRSN